MEVLYQLSYPGGTDNFSGGAVGSLLDRGEGSRLADRRPGRHGGAKFAEETADSIEETQRLAAELKEGLKAAQASVARAQLNIDQLARETGVELNR